MRKLISSASVGALLLVGGLAAAPSAAAHVHGITPLDCTPANANAGANQAFEVSPVLTGLIPRDVGQSPLQPGDGGDDAAVCDL
jgi:hypothetical protein